jgi:hypothetical protein
MFRVLLLCWLVCLPVAAQTPADASVQVRTVVIQTDPPGAQLFDQYGSYLGLSGETLHLDVSRYTLQLDVAVKKSGYEDAALSLKTPELENGAQLPARALVLRSTESVAQWVRGGAAPALGFLSVGAALGFVLNRRRLDVREKRRRADILSEVDMSDSLATQKLGRWRLLQRLGSGGMATVYRAVPDATMNESEAVAVKVMRRDMNTDPEFVERFRREALVTSRMDHPNIVRVLDWGEENGYSYLVMELIDGGTLRERLQNRAVEPAEAWAALEPLCSALVYAQSRGIVHRDLKPENLMITRGGLLKVTDFGLARGGDQQQKITRTGTALGTPAYMSPEQIHGEQPTPAMDQYAVGVIAYELLTGRVPFQDSDPIRQIFMALSEQPTPPSQWVRVSAAVDEVVLKMLSKRAEERYPDIGDAAAALERVLAG